MYHAVICLLLLPIMGLSAVDAAATDPATEIAQACGLSSLPASGKLSFTWTHHPSGTVRSYVWDLSRDTVLVTLKPGGDPIPVKPSGPSASPSTAEVSAHKAFINDSYWLLFPLHMVNDEGISVSDLGNGPVPGFPQLGETRIVAVQYPKEGGYTPGDRYVVYCSEQMQPVAWAYHPGGAAEPKVVTTRASRQPTGSMSLPTRFERADGSVFISISDLVYEP